MKSNIVELEISTKGQGGKLKDLKKIVKSVLF
jgi:hypothetical protein